MTILVGNYHGELVMARLNKEAFIEVAIIMLTAAREYLEKAALTEADRAKTEKLENVGDVIGSLLARLENRDEQ